MVPASFTPKLFVGVNMNKSLIRSSLTLGVLLLVSTKAMAQTDITTFNHKAESVNLVRQIDSSLPTSHTFALTSQERTPSDVGVCLGCIGQV